jgi:hypothetical protein
MSTVIRGATLTALTKFVTEDKDVPERPALDRARRQVSRLKHGEQLMGIRRSEARAMLAYVKACETARANDGHVSPPPLPVEAKRLLETLEIVEGDE